MISAPRSRIYCGWLRHRRFQPRAHAFRYRLWMAWLDLDELPELFDGVPGFSARRWRAFAARTTWPPTTGRSRTP